MRNKRFAEGFNQSASRLDVGWKFIPENPFLYIFNSCKYLLFSVLSLIKGTTQILLPVLSCSFLFYRWFLLLSCALLLLFKIKLSLG